jgi:GTP cyclohydrolase I
MRNKENSEKVEKISSLFKEIMIELGLDLNDESLVETPHRVAKMYVEELFASVNTEPPVVKVFPNDEEYDQMLIEKDITINSVCEHHFVPITGVCHIAYLPEDKIVGLSKLIRVAQYFSKRPQVQERLTQQIGKYLSEVLATKSVAVVVHAKHHCCSMRGAKDPNSSTITSYLGGLFREQPEVRQEFFNLIK